MTEHALDRVGLVIPVGAFGRAVDQAAWEAFRDETGIAVVIDGAACFEIATSSPNRTFGDIPVAISFHATKSFGVGEGGCVVTRDLNLATRVVRAINFGFGARYGQSPNINGKLSEYHAAVGLAELDGWARKVARFSQLQKPTEARSKELVSCPISSLPRRSPPATRLSVVKPPRTLQRLERALNRNGVGSRRWYGGGLRRHNYLSWLEHETLTVEHETLTVTERLADRLVGLPTAPDLSANEITLIADTLNAAIGREARN